MGNRDHPDDAAASTRAAPLRNIIEPVVPPRAPDENGGAEPVSAPSLKAVQDPSGLEPAGATSAPGPSTAPHTGSAQRRSTEPLFEPPDLIRKRYLRAGNQYFLKDEQHRLAFEDRGTRLVTEHSRTDIAESMVEMASAKGWTSIRVSGQDEFKREVWLHASLRGLAIVRYKPQAVDRARLDALREERLTNRIDVDISASVGAGADVGNDSTRPRESGAAASTLPGREEPATRLRGELVAHGDAPYRNNAKNSRSYFVTYRDAVGSHTIWGIDLGRAIPATGAQIGDVVAFENLGKRWVTVNVPVLNEAGEVTGVKPKEVYRNTWEVQIQDRGRDELSDVARAVPQRTVGETVDPVERARETFFNRSPLLRPSTPLTHADQMKRVHVAVIGEVMRSQGFGAQAIERVQAHCARLVGELQEQGVAVPTPRRYDRNAAPTRARHVPSPATPSPAKEIERAVNQSDHSLPSL